MNIFKQLLLLSLLCSVIASCDFDKDNTPPPAKLADFKPTVAIHPLWSVDVGSAGAGQHLNFALSQHSLRATIFTASQSGMITAVSAVTGQKQWEADTHLSVTAGVALNDHQVIVVGDAGIVMALNSANGKILWKSSVGSDITATPAANDNTIIIKTIDGNLVSLAADNGHLLWRHTETEPSLILHAASAPQISGGSVVVGFSNGTLLRADLANGRLNWTRDIATPKGTMSVQHMVDIAADPIITDGHIYVATYQGKIAALRAETGDTEWMQDFSSHSGIAVDAGTVYGTDTNGHVVAFNRQTGELKWRQTALADRDLSGPALLKSNVVVGDAEGYIHILNKQDGHVIGRAQLNDSPILATPISNGSVFYVLTQGGQLEGFSVS